MLTPAALEYITRRGWVKANIERLSPFSYEDFVMFPIRTYTGSIIGSIGRHLIRKQFLVKLHTSPYGYFGWHGPERGRVIFLVEGMFDLGWLLAEDLHAAAYLSNSLNIGQIRVISRLYDVAVIIPDTDLPGITGAIRAKDKLEKAGVVVNIVSIAGYKDISQMFEKDCASSKVFISHLKKVERSYVEGF